MSTPEEPTPQSPVPADGPEHGTEPERAPESPTGNGGTQK